MKVEAGTSAGAGKGATLPSIDISIPVLNEEADLRKSIEKLRAFCLENMTAYNWRIVVADNGSTDHTVDIAKQLSEQYPGQVAFFHIPERGRGRALRKAWLESKADVVSYMDVDLSTGLDALPKLADAIAGDGYDIAIGSRLTKGSRVERRPFKREVTSRGYNVMIKALFFTRFSDAQCGFKGMSRRAADEIIPVTKDLGWFLDSEILIIAEKRGYKIKDVPVHWVDDPETRVKVMKTAWGDIKGLLRLRFKGIPRPVRGH